MVYVGFFFQARFLLFKSVFRDLVDVVVVKGDEVLEGLEQADAADQVYLFGREAVGQVFDNLLLPLLVEGPFLVELEVA